MKGLLAEPKSLESLRKAIQLYQLYINSTSLLLSRPDSAGMEDLYVIQMVSWNNMGHVHRQALFEDTTLASALM